MPLRKTYTHLFFFYIKELFQNAEIKYVISFLKTVKLYTKIKKNIYNKTK